MPSSECTGQRDDPDSTAVANKDVDILIKYWQQAVDSTEKHQTQTLTIILAGRTHAYTHKHTPPESKT